MRARFGLTLLVVSFLHLPQTCKCPAPCRPHATQAQIHHGMPASPMVMVPLCCVPCSRYPLRRSPPARASMVQRGAGPKARAVAHSCWQLPLCTLGQRGWVGSKQSETAPGSKLVPGITHVSPSAQDQPLWQHPS